MCTECGCGLPLDSKINGQVSKHSHNHDHQHEHSHDHQQEHSHEHDHDHSHDHDHNHVPNLVAIHQSILNKNSLQAERNRGYFRALQLLTMNVLSSPGSGKTALLKKTIELMTPAKCGVVVGDLETDNDARRLREAGAPVVQISTGTLCHLDADMLARSLAEINCRELDILFIENVGNLVCPATFDLGEDLRLAMLSVTEGEDKPLKYPPMFRFADVIIVSKMDLAHVCEFDQELAMGNLRKINPRAQIFALSAKTGLGMNEWCAYLANQRAEHKNVSLLKSPG